MTRFIHDKFAKDYLEELLKPYGEVRSSSRVAGEVREIDVLFAPSEQKNSDLEILGLLGRFAATPAIFEPFRNAASEDEICDCLLKLFELRGQLQREAKRNKTKVAKSSIPKLWILTPTASASRLSGFGAVLGADRLPGVCLMPKSWRATIVVIHKLPRTNETLWLRVLGRGKVQNQAIDELEALPLVHPFRKAALELLYNLRKNLLASQNPEPEDRELLMRLAPLYQQDREQAKLEGRQEGLQEGLQEGRRQVLENLLRVRFGSLDVGLAAIIEPLLSLQPQEFTPLLMQLSREELIARFSQSS